MAVVPSDLTAIQDALAAAEAQAFPATPEPEQPPPLDGIDVSDTIVRVAVLRDSDAAPIFIPTTGDVWDEPEDAWAGTVKVEVPDADTDQGPMADLVKLGTPLLVFCSEARGDFQEVWRGTIRQNPRDSSQGTMTVTAYEPHSVLLESDCDVVVKKNQPAADAIAAICHSNNIPTGDISGPATPLTTTQVLRGKKVADAISAIFSDVAANEGGMWLVRSHTGVLETARYGDNAQVWHFARQESAISSTLQGDITNLVTRTVTMAQVDDDKASKSLAENEGLTEFGAGITRLTYTDGKATDKAAVLKNKQVMAKDGFPKWTRKATAPLVMSVRKGHRVRWSDRLNDGYFVVMGVTKNISERTMDLTLQTQDDIDRTTAALQIEVALAAIAPTSSRTTQAKQVGHAVIMHAKPGVAWTSGGTHGGHPAVDIFADVGEPILAPENGTMNALVSPLGGNCGILSGTPSGQAYYFAHCKNQMHKGAVVQGQTIGQVGQTGNAASTQPHVHFAIATSPDIFGQFNGSGDIEGDSSYWEGGDD